MMSLSDVQCKSCIAMPLLSRFLERSGYGCRIFVEGMVFSSLVVLQRKSPTQAMAALTDAEQAKEAASLKKSLEMSVASHDALPPIQAHKRVVLVRHGESTWNAIGRIQGSSDFAVLTPKGESQAETSRQMLLGDNFDSCFYRWKSFFLLSLSTDHM